jgi:hypothetical protein
MGEITDDIIDGTVCALCGVFFREAHGYPVLCESCWSDRRLRPGCQKAIREEL